MATFFAQVEFVAADVPGRFIATMSPDYQEVRMALLGQVMDESRHLEVFRKRALANGGGLMRMIDSVSDVVGGSTDNAREYTELSTRLHIVGEGNVLTLFRLGELMATTTPRRRSTGVAPKTRPGMSPSACSTPGT